MSFISNIPATLFVQFSVGVITLIYVFVGLKVGFELSAVLDRVRKEPQHKHGGPV